MFIIIYGRQEAKICDDYMSLQDVIDLIKRENLPPTLRVSLVEIYESEKVYSIRAELVERRFNSDNPDGIPVVVNNAR